MPSLSSGSGGGPVSVAWRDRWRRSRHRRCARRRGAADRHQNHPGDDTGGCRRGRRAVIRGTITYINEREPAGIIIHDGIAGLFVHYGRSYLATQPRLDLHPGDVVEVEGRTTGSGFAPAVVPERVRRIGRSTLPGPKQVAYAALLSGVFDCRGTSR